MWIYFAIAAVGWVNPGVYGSNGVYVSELYPTHLRATAVGWFFGIGRIGSFLAPAVVGFMLQYGLGAYVLHTFALTLLHRRDRAVASRHRDQRPRAGADHGDRTDCVTYAAQKPLHRYYFRKRTSRRGLRG